MRLTSPALLLVLVALAGCGSSANPMNWFGRDAPDESVLEPIDADNPLIPERSGIFARKPVQYEGTAIDAISDLTLERVPGGLIIRATGRSATQGPFDARLVPLNEDEVPIDGVLTYTLAAQSTQIIGGSPDTREVTVARQLTNQELGDTRTIRVEGLQNALEQRRR